MIDIYYKLCDDLKGIVDGYVFGDDYRWKVKRYTNMTKKYNRLVIKYLKLWNISFTDDARTNSFIYRIHKKQRARVLLYCEYFINMCDNIHFIRNNLNCEVHIIRCKCEPCLWDGQRCIGFDCKCDNHKEGIVIHNMGELLETFSKGIRKKYGEEKIFNNLHDQYKFSKFKSSIDNSRRDKPYIALVRNFGNDDLMLNRRIQNENVGDEMDGCVEYRFIREMLEYITSL